MSGKINTNFRRFIEAKCVREKRVSPDSNIIKESIKVQVILHSTAYATATRRKITIIMIIIIFMRSITSWHDDTLSVMCTEQNVKTL